MDLFDFKDTNILPDYFMVSPRGEIYSKRSKRLLAQTLVGAGYPAVTTKVGGRNGKAYCIRVHREVALTFIPNPENKPQVNHIDGDKSNNDVSNLEWVTASENTQHAYDTDLATPTRGELHGNSKLTEDDVKYIRESYIPYSKEFGTRALGRKFDVTHYTISRIVNDSAWKHVE